MPGVFKVEYCNLRLQITDGMFKRITDLFCGLEWTLVPIIVE